MKWKAHILPDGYWWSGIEIKGKWTPLYRVGKVGHCISF